jgi:hypothetical protein
MKGSLDSGLKGILFGMEIGGDQLLSPLSGH